MVATLLIDPLSADVWLAATAGLLGLLSSDALYRQGWRFTLLLGLFIVVIALALGFGLVLFPIGDVGEDFARSYFVAAVAGFVGLATWLAEVRINK